MNLDTAATRERCARYLKSGWNIPISFINSTTSLCDALDEQEREIERLREERDVYKAALQNWHEPEPEPLPAGPEEIKP